MDQPQGDDFNPEDFRPEDNIASVSSHLMLADLCGKLHKYIDILRHSDPPIFNSVVIWNKRNHYYFPGSLSGTLMEKDFLKILDEFTSKLKQLQTICLSKSREACMRSLPFPPEVNGMIFDHIPIGKYKEIDDSYKFEEIEGKEKQKLTEVYKKVAEFYVGLRYLWKDPTDMDWWYVNLQSLLGIYDDMASFSVPEM